MNTQVKLTKFKQTLVREVRAFAEANYNRDGWDVLVECWDDADIAEAFEQASSVKGAIKRVRRVMKLLKSRSDEIMSLAF